MTASLRLKSLFLAVTATLAAWFSSFAPLVAQTPEGLVRPEVGAYLDHVIPEQDPGVLSVGSGWTTVVAFPNLNFINPVGILAIPGTNKLIVLEREGRIWSFDNNPSTSTKTLVVDLSSQCQGWDDSGLLSLAFHPDFVNNHQIFVWYTWRGGLADGIGDMGPIVGSSTVRAPTLTPNRDRLSRFVLDANFQTSTSTETILLDQKAQSLWHNGCGMFFHPDNGFLYLTDGDDSNNGGNGSYDTTGNNQTITRNLFSCVMRIDVDKRSGSISHAPPARGDKDVTPNWPAYYVPNDNPFVGVANAREEIFALGLRNPFRMTIDPVTRRIFIGDVGGSDFEELNIIEPTDPYGLNFQWSSIEGGARDLVGTYPGVSRRPSLFYSHNGSDGSCVIGGYVYRGAALPELYGKYIFGDAVSGQIWYLDESTATKRKLLLATLPQGPGPSTGGGYRGLSSFGLDAAGELYVCQMSSVAGQIYKLKRGGPAPLPPLPATLGATGIFTDMATLAPSPRLTPYEINVPFFSDGAVKSRFAAIPSGTSIGFKPNGDWEFPVGSVFVKHFELPVSDLDISKRRRLETRVLVVKADHTVYGATYRWRDDQSDADLLSTSRTDTIPVETASFGSLTGLDIGRPGVPGATVQEGNQITLTTGQGAFNGSSDAIQFAHQLRSGDFDVAVRLVSVTSSTFSGTAGLMVRESLDPGSAMVALTARQEGNNSTSSYFYSSVRMAQGPSSQVNISMTVAAQTWIRMQRQGNEFISSFSGDGITWHQINRRTLEMARQVEFGLIAVADNIQNTTAKFEVGVRNQNWYFPSRQDCVTCHNAQSSGVLGMSTRQMNRDATFNGGVVQNQLSAWNHAGYFHDGPVDASLSQLERLVRPDDASASLEQRARSYLDANCANCHRPGSAQAFWDARYGTPLDQQGILRGALANPLGNSAARVVTPGSLANSMIHTRISITGANQMPPIGRKTVDAQGVTLLAQWISGMPPSSSDFPFVLTAAVQEHPQWSPAEVSLDWVGDPPAGAFALLERSLDGVHYSSIFDSAAWSRNYTDYSPDPFSPVWYRLALFKSGEVTTYSNVVEVKTVGSKPAPEIRLSGEDELIGSHDFDAGAKASTSFGILAPGASASRTYRVANTGTLPLHLTGTPRFRLTGAEAGTFTVTSASSSAVVEPGGALDFTVVFAPKTEGVKNAIITILCDDPDEGTTAFALTGECLADDLAGWWKFDETSGDTAADASGRGNPAVIGLTPAAWVANGAINGALAVTGASGDGAVIAGAPGINPGSAFTVSLWAKAGVWEQGRTLFSKGGYSLMVDGNQLVSRVGTTPLATAVLPSTHAWVHLAVVFDMARTTLYVNGVPAGSVEHALAAADANGDLVLGAPSLAAAGTSHFNGWIDEVRLYRSALNESRVAGLAGQAVTVTMAVDNNSYAIGKQTDQYGIEIIVTRTGSIDQALPVRVSMTGSAVADADYSVGWYGLNTGPENFVIPQGQTSASFHISPLRGALATGPRELFAELGEASGYRRGSPAAIRIDLWDTPYNDWKIAAFGGVSQANAPTAAADADPDGDGISNLMEAALMANPLVFDGGHLPQLALEKLDGFTYLTGTYLRPAQSQANNLGLNYNNLWSSDLDWWDGCWDFPGYPVDNGDGTMTVKFYSGEPVEWNSAQFLKLQVEGE